MTQEQYEKAESIMYDMNKWQDLLSAIHCISYDRLDYVQMGECEQFRTDKNRLNITPLTEALVKKHVNAFLAALKSDIRIEIAKLKDNMDKI